MDSSFLAFRRDLPGGHVVMIEVEERAGDGFLGRLQVERRTDPARRRLGQPPVVAEARGETAEAVLRQLRALASSDVEISRLLAKWQASR